MRGSGSRSLLFSSGALCLSPPRRSRREASRQRSARPLSGVPPMTLLRPYLLRVVVAVASLSFLGACATRPINPPLLHYEPSAERQFEGLEMKRGRHEDLIILAFSGGGMRAAAFS